MPVCLYMCTRPLIIFLARYYTQNFVGTVRPPVEAIIIFVTENYNLKLRKKMSQGEDPAEYRIDHGSSEKLGYTFASILPFILHLSFMVATTFLSYMSRVKPRGKFFSIMVKSFKISVEV